jgi:hypothetical protein
MALYLTDSNFFIQAHRVSYPLDVATSFWNKVQKLANEGKIISIDKVRSEIYNNEDELKKWIENNLPKNFFKDTSTLLDTYNKVTSWAMSMNNQYVKKAIDEFLDAEVADAWLISYSIQNPVTIITHEISAPMGKSKIKIPDVCIHFNIPYINTIEMFRQTGEQF